MLTAPVRLVQIPEVVTPPPECLVALRELSPNLELVCVLPHVWWVGEVKMTSAATMIGQYRLGELRARRAAGGLVRPLAFWKAQLMAQGFRMLALVSTSLPTPSQCVNAVAPTLIATPQSLEADWNEMMRHADGRAKRETNAKWRQDYAEYQGRDAYRHAFHRPIISIPGA